MTLLRGALGAALLTVSALPLSNAAYAYDDWHVTVTPYLWLPGVDADFKFHVPPGGTGEPKIKVGPTDVLDVLDFAFMGAIDIREGRWGAFGDFMYVDLEDDDGIISSITGPGGEVEIPVNTGTTTSINGDTFTGGLSYDFYHGEHSASAVFVGFRYLHVDPSVTWSFVGPLGLLPQTGTASESHDNWDGIVGLKGRFGFGDSRWFVDYYGDVGTGDSELTWQGIGGIGYAFNWADLKLAYRYLHYSGGSAKLIDNASLYGPALGLSFHF